MNPSGGSDQSTASGSVREQSVTFDALNTGPLVGDLNATPDSTQAIINGEERQARDQQHAHDAARARSRMVKFAVMAAVLAVGLGLVVLRHEVGTKTLNSSQTDASQRFPVTSVPLASLVNNSSALSVQNAQTLSINGQLNVNNSLVLTPTTQPSGGVTGQLYYNQATNELSYYNGSQFTTLLNGNQKIVSSVDNASGSLVTGSGLSVSGNTLSNSGVTGLGDTSGDIGTGKGVTVTGGTLDNTGVLTLQGEAGNVTLASGPGIIVSGTTLSNSGLLSLGGQNGNIAVGTGLAIDDGTLHNTGIISAVGAGLITVTNDGNGNITIDGPSGGSGSGTVASPGGTIGTIAMFTGVQTVADSIISASGSTVTVGGDLNVTGGVTLGAPLTVANGGTGAVTAANARANLGAAGSGANSDITSLSALTTALSVSQGGTGIGVLPTDSVLIGNGTSAISGVTTGTSGLCLISTSGTPTFQTCPGSGGVASVNSLTGALTVAGASAGSVTSSGNTITINNATSATKGLASFDSTDLTVTGGSVDTVQGISVTATPTFGQLTLTSSQATGTMLTVDNTDTGATGNLLNLELNGSSKLSVSPAGSLTLSGTVNGQTIGSSSSFTGNVGVTGSLAVNTIAPTGALTVGVGGQSFTLQGNTSSVISATNGTNTTTVGFQSPTANVTYDFATAVAGSYDICTTAGNCTGVGGGVTTEGGTTNTLAEFTGSGTIGNSIITESGSTVTVGGTLSVNTLTPTAALTVGASSQNLTLQGAAVSLTDTSGGITNSLVFVTPSGSNKTITVPNASGTVAVSASGPLSLDANGNLTCPTCLTSGGGGGTSGVSSVNSATGALTLQGTDASSITTSGTTITVNDATSTVKGLASFDSTDLTVTSGNVDTVQSIAVTATPSFAGLTLTNALTVTSGGTGANNATSARANLSAAKSGANSDITSLSGLTTALSVLQGGTGDTSLTANGVLVGNGTGAVSSVTGTNGQCLMVVSGTPAFGTCPGGGSSPVSSLDELTGALTINNSSGLGSNITINNAKADGTTEGIATFNGTNFIDNGAGLIDTIQDIDTSASPSFAGLSLGSALTVANGGTGSTTPAGARTDLGAAGSGDNTDITQLSSLTTAITVSQGGTGLTALTANELLFANSTSSISQLGNGTSGQCLVSNGTGTAPSFQTCTGAGGVSSLDTLTGSITINNTTGSGGYITIANAAADGSTKGIAAFNATDFTASSGVINTIQGIAATSAPTFGGLTLNTALAVGSGGTGLSTLTADGILYASSTSAISQLSAGTSGQCLISNGTGVAPSWQSCPGSGTSPITGTGTAGKLALFNGTSSLTSSDITDTAGTSISIASAVSLQVQGAATFENAANSTTAFQVESAGGTDIFGVDTTNGTVGTVGTTAASTNSASLVLQSGNASGTTSTSGNVSLDVGSGTSGLGTLSIGGTNATTIDIGSTGTTLKGTAIHIGDTSSATNTQTVVVGSIAANQNDVTTIQGGGASGYSTGGVNIQTATYGTINVGNDGNSNTTVDIGQVGYAIASTVNIATSTGTATQQVNIGSTSGTSNSVDIYSGGSTGAINLQPASGGAVNIATAAASTVTIGNVGSTNAITFKGSNITQTITGGGSSPYPSDIIKTAANSSDAFAVQNSSSVSILNVDTSADRVTVNSTGTPLILNMTASGDSDGILFETSAASTGEVGIAGASSQIITQAAAGDLALESSSGNIYLAAGGTNEEVKIDTNGDTTFKNLSNTATNAFQIQNAGGTNLFSVNTSTNTVNVGAGGSDVLASFVNVGTSTGTTQTVTVGSTASTSVTTIQGGSGGVLIAASANNNVGVGTSVSDTITIGDASGNNPVILQGNGITQTITGAASNPSDIIKTSTSSTQAFQIQNSSGYSVLNVNTASSILQLGNKTLSSGQGVAGSLAFADGTNDNNLLTINTSTLSNSYILSLPSSGVSGNSCLQSTSGSTTSATVLTFASCGGSGDSTTLQQAYANSAGASPSIDMTSTDKGFTIQNDYSTPITGVLFSVNAGASSGLGSSLFSVSNIGDITANSSETTSTTGAFAYNANSVSSGNGLNVSANGLTTGNGVNIATTSILQTAGSLVNVSDTATLIASGGNDAASLINISRSLTADITGSPPAVAYDKGSVFYDVHDTSTTWTNAFTVAANSDRYLLVSLESSIAEEGPSYGACTAPSGITYDGTAMSSVGTDTSNCIYYYGLAAPADGSSYNVVVTYSSTPNVTLGMSVSSWYNIAQTSSTGTFSSSNGYGYSTPPGPTDPSVTATSTSGQVVVDTMFGDLGDTAGSYGPSTGQTQIGYSSISSGTYCGDYCYIGSSYKTATGSSTTMSWTGPSDSVAAWTEDAIGLNPAALDETVTAPVASISNSCTLTAGTCADASNVLSLNQQYSGATGSVLGVQNSGSGAAIGIQNSGSGAAIGIQNSGSSFGLQIQNGSSVSALTVTTTNLTGIDTTTAGTAAVLTLGEATSSGYSIAAEGGIKSSLADYAEYFPQAAPGQLQPGDVACLNASSDVEECSASNSDNLIGVVSTAPGFVGNNQVYDASDPDSTALISMVGQVPVHASAANGPIQVGDMLTVDPATGLAVKATSAGTTIGEALGNLTSGTGTIQLYIHIGYYDPLGLQSDGVSSGYVIQGDDATLTNLTVNGTATIGTLDVTGSATITNLTITTSLSTAGITINGHIVTGGATPTVAAGAASGTGATVAITGDDTSGKITVTLGNGAATGDLADLTFAQAYGAAPNVVVTAGNSYAALVQQYVSPTTTGFSLNAATTSGFTSGQTYIFYYHAIQ